MLPKLSRRLHKIKFYLSESFFSLIPGAFFIFFRKNIIQSIRDYDKDLVFARVNYYNKINFNFDVGYHQADWGLAKIKKSYYYDFIRVARYFSKNCKFNFLFGDITHVPSTPAFLKSRPIECNNRNSVLLKLNAVRHFFIVKDVLRFEDKVGMAVWRGNAIQPWRKSFVQKYYNSKICNVGQVDEGEEDKPTWRPFMSIREQLLYKYIVSIEGNDVATNLKWIMSSNSLCFMRKPKFETWFMEGTLVPDVHYVQLKDDFSDLEEKIEFFNKNPEAAKCIIKNANKHYLQFEDARLERLISVMVFEKYLKRSGQFY